MSDNKIDNKDSDKYVPKYDFTLVLFAESLGWDHRTVMGDFASHEAVVEHYQKVFNVGWEEACEKYRQLIAEEIEEYLESKLGKRS